MVRLALTVNFVSKFLPFLKFCELQKVRKAGHFKTTHLNVFGHHVPSRDILLVKKIGFNAPGYPTHTVWNSYLKKRVLSKTGISANSSFPKSSSMSPSATKPLQRAQRHQLQICRTLDSNLVTRCVCCHDDAPRRPPACGRRGTRRRGFRSGCVYIWMHYLVYMTVCTACRMLIVGKECHGAPWKRCLGSGLLCCRIARSRLSIWSVVKV